MYRSTCVLLVLSGLACSLPAGAQENVTFRLFDRLEETVESNGAFGSVDADANHDVFQVLFDNTFRRDGADNAAYAYRIFGQASADSAAFSASDRARVAGTVDLEFDLPNVALWNINVSTNGLWTLATSGSGATASFSQITLSGNGAAVFPSLSIPGGAIGGNSSGSGGPNVTPGSFRSVANVLPGSGGVSLSMAMEATSFGGEAIAYLGNPSGLSGFGLDDTLAGLPRFIGVTVSLTPHLNLSGQTLTGDITLVSGEHINGFGALTGSVATLAGNNTTVEPGGRLELGSAASQVTLAGAQQIGSGTLVLRDADAALLGGTTTMAGGRLEIESPAGARLEGPLTGHGTVEGAVVNDAFVGAAGGSFTLLGPVSGTGGYAGDIRFEGVFSPGRSPTFVTFQHDMTLGAGATLEIELGGLLPGFEHDALDVFGTARLDGALSVALIDGFGLDLNQTFDILRAGELVGMFDGLAEGGRVGTFGGYDLFITYAAGDGNDVRLYTSSVTAIPEPQTYALLLAGLGLLGFRKWGRTPFTQ